MSRRILFTENSALLQLLKALAAAKPLIAQAQRQSADNGAKAPARAGTPPSDNGARQTAPSERQSQPFNAAESLLRRHEEIARRVRRTHSGDETRA